MFELYIQTDCLLKLLLFCSCAGEAAELPGHGN